MVKYRIMRKFTFILAIGFLVSAITVVLEIYIKFSGERDEMWRYEWLMESSWYIIFSLFLFAVLILMRPNERSKLLALVEELRESDFGSTNTNQIPGPSFR